MAFKMPVIKGVFHLPMMVIGIILIANTCELLHDLCFRMYEIFFSQRLLYFTVPMSIILLFTNNVKMSNSRRVDEVSELLPQIQPNTPPSRRPRKRRLGCGNPKCF